MIDSAYVDTDSNGDKIVKAGQFLVWNATRDTAYPTGYMENSSTNRGYMPLAGVLIEDLNLRDGNAPGSVLIDGWVDANFAIDFGRGAANTAALRRQSFGGVSTQTKTAAASTNIEIQEEIT